MTRTMAAAMAGNHAIGCVTPRGPGATTASAADAAGIASRVAVLVAGSTPGATCSCKGGSVAVRAGQVVAALYQRGWHGT